MNSPKQWLRDVVLVRFPDNGYKGETLVLPTGIKHATRVVEAEVVAVGTKFRHKDDIKVGDKILVDSYLGNRRTFDDLGEVCTFDGEDIIAKIETV